MALYLGADRVKININGVTYCLNLFSIPPITNGIRLLSSEVYILKDANGVYLTALPELELPSYELLSSDNYILTDSNGLYLIPSDYTEIVVDNIILSSDNYILTDSNGLYLVFKESE